MPLVLSPYKLRFGTLVPVGKLDDYRHRNKVLSVENRTAPYYCWFRWSVM